MAIDETGISLLAVWNPLFKPETIAAHVESLRQAPPDRRWTWWGRFYAGKRSRTVEELMPALEGLTRACPRVLYVTDFNSLHALRIDEIHVGSLPVHELAQAPAYYRQSTHSIPIWFRVRDARVIHWAQLPTLTALADLAEVRFEEGTFRRSEFGKVDPYAAHKWDWPVLVDAPRVDEIFPEGREFADDPNTLAPQGILDAMASLRAAHPAVWDRLDPGSRLALASGELVRQVAKGQPFDVATAAIGLTRALEIELCRRLVLEGLVRALSQVHPVEQIQRALFSHKEPRPWFKQAQPPALGEAVFALRNLRDLSREAEWEEVTELSEEAHLLRIEAASHLRNKVAHGATVAPEAVERLNRVLWGEDPLFARIHRALSELARR